MACPTWALPEALGILYRRVPEELRPLLVAEVLDEARRGLIDLSGLWIAVRGAEPAMHLAPGAPPPVFSGRIVGAMLTQPLSARAAAAWAPEVLPSWRRGATAAALVRAAMAGLRARGFRLAQAVLDESASSHGSIDLGRGGLPRVTELAYMERPTASQPPPSARPGQPSPSWEWRHFCDSTEAEFRAVMQATYEGSLDMPELGSVRSLDDIIADHRETGRFEPSRWRLGTVAGVPGAGAVLLLAEVEVPEPDTWEVIYLGLTPAARGLGLGHAAIAHALELAGAKVSRLELAVDVRNIPAVRLYERTGFVVIDRRIVHLLIFDRMQPG